MSWRTALRALACVLLVAYTLAALVIDFSRALPLALFELAALAYLLASRNARWLNGAIARVYEAICPSARFVGQYNVPRTPWQRLGLVAALVALHLIVVACLGAQSGERWLPVVGLALLVAGCYAGSRDRRSVRWRTVAGGLALQFWLCVLLLRTPIGLAAVNWLACRVNQLLGFAGAGARFVFGAQAAEEVWAFKVLTVTLFFASLCSVLMHLNVLQFVFGRLGGLLAKLLGVSRAEAICGVANIFLGQSEAPLLFRPIVPLLNASQLHCIMASGFASVAGSTLGAYILMGAPATHLLAASVMSAPAAIAIAKLLHPDAPPAASPALVEVGGGGQEMGATGPPHVRSAACSRRARVGAPPDSLASADVVPSFDGLGPEPNGRPPVPGAVGPPGAASVRDGEAAIELGNTANSAGGEGGDGGGDGGGAQCVEPGGGVFDVDELPAATTDNIVQAAAEGAIHAVPLVACIAATLLAFLALVAMLDAIIGYLGSLIGIAHLSFTQV